MRVLRLEGLSYAEVHALQIDLVERVARGDDPPTLIVVEHEPIVTVGRGARADAVRTRLPVVEVERGGGVTAHGPGQVVVYPIVPLPTHDLRGHLRRLERAVIAALARLQIAGVAREGATGVWTETRDGPRKLCSIGIAARRWVTFHGLALNVTTDMSIFEGLDPCGLDDGVMASVASVLVRDVGCDEVSRVVVEETIAALAAEGGPRAGT